MAHEGSSISDISPAEGYFACGNTLKHLIKSTSARKDRSPGRMRSTSARMPYTIQIPARRQITRSAT